MNIGSDGTELPDPFLKAAERQEDSNSLACLEALFGRTTITAAFVQRSIKTVVDSWKVQPTDFCLFLLFQPNKP